MPERIFGWNLSWFGGRLNQIWISSSKLQAVSMVFRGDRIIRWYLSFSHRIIRCSPGFGCIVWSWLDYPVVLTSDHRTIRSCTRLRCFRFCFNQIIRCLFSFHTGPSGRPESSAVTCSDRIIRWLSLIALVLSSWLWLVLVCFRVCRDRFLAWFLGAVACP
jgi:hypothetical protein